MRNKMSKKYFLKKSFLRNFFNAYAVRGVLSLVKFKFPKGDKTLVLLTNGLGDILVTDKLSQKVQEKYGKENVVFLIRKPNKDIAELLKYNSIFFERRDKYNFFYRLKMMYKLNMMGFVRVLNFDGTNDNTIANLFIPEIIGGMDRGEMNSHYNRFYTRSFEFKDDTVLENLAQIGEGTMEEKLLPEDLVPDIRDRFSIKNEKIVVAVGSTARLRVCSPYRMIKYLKEVAKKYPEENIYLIGNGKLQKEYAETLIKLDGNINLVDMTDKTSLKEAMEYVAESKLFIGFESGLYNLCYALRKKGIIFFRELDVPFHHKVPWLKILGPDEKIGEEDKEYPDKNINSISVEQFKRALNEIN